MLPVNGITIAVETFGARPLPMQQHDLVVVLVMGATASMVWWPTSFCEAIAHAGYFVVRYDHRDTGGSTKFMATTAGHTTTTNSSTPRKEENEDVSSHTHYSVEDLADDLLGVMDALHLTSAHLVGMSLGGFLSQIIAVSHPKRVRTLTLIGSEPLGGTTSAMEQLPGIDERFLNHFAKLSDLDWDNLIVVERFLVEIGRLSAGDPDRFDEARTHARVAMEIQRVGGCSSNMAFAFHHAMVKTRQDWTGATHRITQPTLIIHGAKDPIVPVQNGQALACLIPGAGQQKNHVRLHILTHAGHELNALDLEEIQSTILSFLLEHGQRGTKDEEKASQTFLNSGGIDYSKE